MALTIIAASSGEANRHLLPGGALIMEIGADLGRPVAQLLSDAGNYTAAKIYQDYACRDRVVVAYRPAADVAKLRRGPQLMDKIVVHGGKRLTGEVTVSGSKNAALPVLISSLLTAEPCTYRRVPNLADIHTTLKLLGALGVKIDKDAWDRGKGDLRLHAETVTKLEASYDLVKTMRASFLVLGPLTARFGQARVSTPGGCAIGARPINLHLKGLEAMGATIEHSHGYVEATASRLRGAKIYLDLPSVGATENLMMAATLADGTTFIENAAKEPEIEDLADALKRDGRESSRRRHRHRSDRRSGFAAWAFA